jgi:D-xylose transport system permease protein
MTDTTSAPNTASRAATSGDPESSGGLLTKLRSLGSGDLGSLRVVIVLAFIWIFFAVANPAFLSAANLTNLAL